MPTETLLLFAGYSPRVSRATVEQGGTALFAAVRRACAVVGYGVTRALREARDAVRSLAERAWRSHVAWCESTAKPKAEPLVTVGKAPAPTVCPRSRRHAHAHPNRKVGLSARPGQHRPVVVYPTHGRIHA